MPFAFLRPSRIRFWDLLLFVFLTTIMLAGALGVVTLTGIQSDLKEAAARPEAHPLTLLAMMATLFGIALFAAVVSVARFGLTAIWMLGFRKASIEWWLGGMLAMVALSAFLAVGVLPMLEKVAGLPGQISTSVVVRQLTTEFWIAALAVLVIGVLAPFVEELVFRGMVFGWLIGRFPGWVAITGSAVAFGLAHIEPMHILTATVLGIWLGYTRLRSGSIWPCIFAHMVNNTVFVLALHLFPTI